MPGAVLGAVALTENLDAAEDSGMFHLQVTLSDLWLIRQLMYDLAGSWASSVSEPKGDVVCDSS